MKEERRKRRRRGIKIPWQHTNTYIPANRGHINHIENLNQRSLLGALFYLKCMLPMKHDT